MEVKSDEEKVGDKWIHHPPSYRSELFSRFIEKLYSRASDARFPRDIGSPRQKEAPSSAKAWMLAHSTMNASTSSVPSDGREAENDNESEELFSSSTNDSD